MRKYILFLLILFSSTVLAQPDIKTGEYYVGLIDPGAGNGIAFSAVDGAWDEVVECIIASAQTIMSSSSPVLINIRLKDNYNNWGPLFKKTLFFSVANTTSRSVDISYAEYFFGVFDPGEGQGTPILAFDGAFDDAVEAVLRTNATWTMASGPTLFNIRMRDAYNNWGPLFKKTIFPYGSNPDAQLIAQGDTIRICPQSPVTLTYNGPNGYTPIWFNGLNDTSITFVPSSVGYYSVNATLGNSTYSDSIYVDTLAAPFPVISPSGSVLVCGSSTISLSTPLIANTTYQWFYNSAAISGATNSNYLPTQTGNYYVVATSSLNGCSGSSPITTLSSTATISPSGAVSSCVTPFILSTIAGTGNTYQWKLNGVIIPGATSSTYSATTSGNYSVTVYNGSCTSISSNTTLSLLSAPSTPTISASGPTTFCPGGSVILTSSSSTGNTWSNGATTQSITVNSSGSYIVTVSNGTCSASSSPTIISLNTAPSIPAISSSGPTTFCTGGSVVLTSSSSIGNTWSNGATTQSITVSNSGNYSVTVSNGTCSATSAPTLVTVNNTPSTPTISVSGPTTFCSGGSVLLTSSSATGNIWSNGATTQSISVTNSGNYSVTVSNGNCSATSSLASVTVNPTPITPTIFASGPTTFCSGGSIVLSSSSASGNTWSNGATTQSITVSNSGSYNVTVSNGSCTASSSPIVVTVNSLPSTPTINANGPTTFCSGGSVVLTSSSPTGNTWSNGASTPSITVTSSGNYSVTVSNGNCSATSNIETITVNLTPNTPTIFANSPLTFCAGGSVVLTSSSATGNSWSNGATTQSITVTSAGIYSVTVSNGSCTATSNPTNVTTLPAPTPIDSIYGQIAVDTVQPFVYSIVPDPSATAYTWSTNCGTIINGQGTNSVSIVWDGVQSCALLAIVSNGSCADSASLVVYPSGITGINENYENDGITLYPNPANRYLLVGYDKSILNLQIEVYDIFGKKVVEINNVGENPILLNTDSLVPGTYSLRFIGSNLLFNKLFVKQ